MKCRVVIVRKTGGPEVLEIDEREVAAPAPGEVLVRHTAIGLNFVEIYFRSGLYTPPALPYVPGTEASGVVEEIGPGVHDFKVGDRVVYSGGPMGAYSEARVISASLLVKLPDGVSDQAAAAAMLKGMTAHCLLHSSYRAQRGDTILLHAAAGGVGLIACQWAKHIGATVIATVGSEEKARLVRSYGADHVINYSTEDFVARVRDITGGRMVPVVYDSVGQATFMKSLDCLRLGGTLVCFGQASGKVPPFDVNLLGNKGSLYVTRLSMQSYTSTRPALLERAGALFDAIEQGIVKIDIKQRFPLLEAAKAQRALAARETVGQTLLIP